MAQVPLLSKHLFQSLITMNWRVFRMVLNILNSSRERIEIIDYAESILWTKQFQDTGGCVLTLPPSQELLDLFINDAMYITRDDDDMICKIVKVGLTQDNDSGKFTLTITALGGSYILNQRIVWSQFNSAQYTAEIYIRFLVRNNCIVPTDQDRSIDELILGQLNGWSEMVDKQVTYTNVLEVVRDMCKTYGYGFKIVQTTGNKLSFDLYKGIDRSESQSVNSYVVFSPEYNNLNSFDWELDKSDYRNVVLVGGEGEGTARKTATVGSERGIARSELFVDAKNLSSEAGAVVNYNQVMQESGEEALALHNIKQAFACSLDIEQYEYKTDYDLGDIVTVKGEFGLSFDAKIIEVIETEDEKHYRVTVNLEI